MDTLSFTSRVTLTKSSDGKFVAHATTVDGTDIALENAAAAVKAVDATLIKRYRYDRKDGSGSFDKWVLPGSLDLAVKPLGATLGRIESAKAHPFDDGGLDAATLDNLAVEPPKPKTSAAPAGGFAAAVAAASDPLV